MNGKADGQRGSVNETSTFRDPEVLNQALPQLKKTVTYTDVSKDVSQALHGHRDGVILIMTAEGEILEIVVATITRRRRPRPRRTRDPANEMSEHFPDRNRRPQTDSLESYA